MKIIWILLSVCLLTSCIKPFDQEIDEEEKKLVVSGLITNESGPYTVKLDKTISYGKYFGQADPSVKNATVIISDETGFREVLKEVKDGEYQTDANSFQGRVGGTYTLYIKLKDGSEYTSAPETLKSVVPLQNLNAAYKEVRTIDKDGVSVSTPTFEMQVDLQDPADRNFYRWLTKGTFEVITQPENFTVLDRYGNEIRMPKPCCAQCWVDKSFTSVNVRDDREFNGNRLAAQPVVSIPITPMFFGTRFRVEVAQLSLSEQGFYFWDMLQKQSSGTGNVQDPAPANAIGNMKNITNSEKKVLGFFGASAVSRSVLYINRQQLPVKIDDLIYPDDCRTIPSATNNKPSFWQ